MPAVWPRSRKELGQDNGRVSAEIILAILKAVLEDSSYYWLILMLSGIDTPGGWLGDVEKESKLSIVGKLTFRKS